MRGWDSGDGYHLIDYYIKDHDDNSELHHQHQVIVKCLQGLYDFTEITTPGGSTGTGSANGLEGYATLSLYYVTPSPRLRPSVTPSQAPHPRSSASTSSFRVTVTQLTLGSDTSILSSCGEFRLKKSSNVIIRNLKL
ncbi:hypothetical protein FRC05_007651 [Tulasnella sp. 425]|nr:hypothetical protein FRC05_007651 [Tulasnella sp. 425]